MVRRRHVWPLLALATILAILGLFVLPGVAGGMACLVAMLLFVGGVLVAVRRRDPDGFARSERVGMSGWFGGGF